MWYDKMQFSIEIIMSWTSKEENFVSLGKKVSIYDIDSEASYVFQSENIWIFGGKIQVLEHFKNLDWSMCKKQDFWLRWPRALC